MENPAGTVVAIVPAAGVGKRFGQGNNKTLCTFLDKPLIIWSLEVLQAVEEITEIIPVVRQVDRTAMSRLVKKFCIRKVKRFASGGKERQDSVRNALSLLDDATSVVLIHDGARPLADRALIKHLLTELGGFDGVVAGVPVKDTIKEARKAGVGRPGRRGQHTEKSRDSKEAARDIVVQRTLNRDSLWAIQTPQVFRYAKIKAAYEKARKDDYYATDDAALLERYGGKVKVVMGSYRNIKITTPEDIAVAEALCRNTCGSA